MRIVPWIPPPFRDRAAAGRALAEAVAGLELDEPVVVGVAWRHHADHTYAQAVPGGSRS